MANGVYDTGYDIEINLTREDLGNPNHDGLLEEITRPVGERPRHLLQCLKDRQGGQCQCALDGKTPWMFIRRQRRDDKEPPIPTSGNHRSALCHGHLIDPGYDVLGGGRR